MHESGNRSIRTAIGLLLTKLRLGLSNRILSTLFSIGSVRTTAKIVHQVREALMKDFVPHFMGVKHITREQIQVIAISFIPSVSTCKDSFSNVRNRFVHRLLPLE